ncbi:DUF3667 domain-containing protein [Christiangramia sp. OXR-203]|uniref:DUF3667 domain-containing protein n=1 Tax=Christiangramia sp. OXR-203 TaxID=3100176 RepID=UPI002AC9A792|nr:DUF3667 domain-containing protein [Christiangramia sp. OXR-203]WPY97997.1 DUF3667 domain-containing protein [Christiangramia sp. OXR-203]
MTHCKNCNFAISEEQNYCSNCGAKIMRDKLSVPYLFREFFESFWSIDSNKPVLTFVDLFRRPVNVIQGYIEGLRKKYINPYGYFTIALTLTGLYTYVNLKYFPEYLEGGGLEVNTGERDITKEVTTMILEHMNLITFLFIPVITLFSRLVFLKNKKYNLAEHLIVHLYAYSHISIVFAILILLSFSNQSLFAIMNYVSLPFYVIYYGYIFKKMYDLSLWKIILKSLLFLLLLLLVFLIVSLVIGPYMAKLKGVI